jgi:hypothetical protein
VAAGEGHRWFRTNTEAAEADLAEVHGRFWHYEVEALIIIGCMDNIWRSILKQNVLLFLYSEGIFIKVIIGMQIVEPAVFKLLFILFFN